MTESVEPPRHGWGGSKKIRDQALKRKAEDKQEKIDFPEKFSGQATPVDYKLLEEMQKSRE